MIDENFKQFNLFEINLVDFRSQPKCAEISANLLGRCSLCHRT